MVTVTKLNNREIIINNDLIESIESTPDTTITMTTGRKLIVLETVDEIISRIVNFRKNLMSPYSTTGSQE